jgi:hypothetical protein
MKPRTLPQAGGDWGLTSVATRLAGAATQDDMTDIAILNGA